ncbi:hypothetical protein [Daejeonella sp. JGW-45]|uniref:hypothetical protein n=1 Tax=Daejeonella sp. JGW-45 TaxID=3034148 RepID=UPI0023ED81B5|nr:hypothetical protein [Daejeonella sp. JGW-45]
MAKTYKFISVLLSEIDKEQGNYPIQYLVPYGPEHPNESAAEKWLEDNAETDKKYILIPIYSFQ